MSLVSPQFHVNFDPSFSHSKAGHPQLTMAVKSWIHWPGGANKTTSATYKGKSKCSMDFAARGSSNSNLIAKTLKGSQPNPRCG
jgi:hypothetical protein